MNANFRRPSLLTLVMSAALTLPHPAPATSTDATPTSGHGHADPGRLVLNGRATRTVWGFPVYRVSLYLEKASTDAHYIMNEDGGAKRVRMEMLREVSGGDMIDAVRASVTKNLTAGEAALFSGELAKYFDCLERVGDIAAGRVIGVDYMPSVGMVLTLDGQRLAVIEGREFYHAMLRVWLGNPPQPSIRQGLLSAGG